MSEELKINKINKLEDLLQIKEGQLFDRKNARIGVKDLGNDVIGFGNADGGILAIGLDDDGTPSGFRGLHNKEDEIKEFFRKWILPPLNYTFKDLEFTHLDDGLKDNVLIVEIEQSNSIHKNRKDEVYLRCGRETKKLNFEERQQLQYDKGLQRFEMGILEKIRLEDLDLDLLNEYGKVIGIQGPKRILLARNLAELKNGEIRLNYAGILLFGKNPQKWIDLARVRILRFEGIDEKSGEQLNITKDEKIEGSIINQIKKSIETISTMLRDFTYLNKDSGKFIAVSEYPLLTWQEAIINAVTHREYSMFGSDIQVKLFEDHLEVISPGNFPSIVRESNVRDIHFSRNPKIARVLCDLDYVRELGEGVNRMYTEMEKEGLPKPIFESGKGRVMVTLFNNAKDRLLRKEVDLLKLIKHNKINSLSKDERSTILYVMKNKRITTRECKKLVGKSEDTARNILKKLKNYNPPFLIDRRKYLHDPKAYYEFNLDIMLKQIEKEGDIGEEEKQSEKQVKLL